MKKTWLLLTVVALVCCGAGSALAEPVVVESKSISETREDLSIRYTYPVFVAEGDDALTEALEKAITQDFLTRYDELLSEYEAARAERTEEQEALYAENDDYVDEIYGEYTIQSNDGLLLQLVYNYSYRPAGGNGNWDRIGSYVFSVPGRRLLYLTDLFAEEDETVVSTLSQLAFDASKNLDGLYDMYEVGAYPSSPFYLSEDLSTLTLLFAPYELSTTAQEISIPIGETGLTFVSPVSMAPAEPSDIISIPMLDSTPEAFAALYGREAVLPEGAADIAYYAYAVGNGRDLAEIRFTLDGAQCIYRAQRALDAEDISGMNGSLFSVHEIITDSPLHPVVYVTPGSAGVITWYDTQTGFNHSLTMYPGATDGLLLDLANVIMDRSDSQRKDTLQ